MAVRNLTILKLAALLIFTFELFAPVILAGQALPGEGGKTNLTHNQSRAGLFVSLLCEEAGSEEEREGKEHKIFPLLTEVNFVAVFQCLVKQENLQQPAPYYSKINSGTTLLAFISVYRI